MPIRSICVAATVLLTSAAWAQSDAPATPRERVSGGALSERAPGNTIRAALARHNALSASRFNRTDDDSDDSPSSPPPETTSALGGSLSDLLSLGSTLLGGNIGSTLGLAGGVVGGGTTPATGSDSTTGEDTSTSDTDSLTQLIEDQIAAESGGRAQNPGDKALNSAQTVDGDGDELKFRVRWTNAMLSTTFAALSIGLQSRFVVDFFADIFSPIFPSPDAGGNGDGATAREDGIEDGPPADDAGAGGGSQV